MYVHLLMFRDESCSTALRRLHSYLPPAASHLTAEDQHPEIKEVSSNPPHRLLSDGYNGL